MTFGERLKILIDEKGLQQQEFASLFNLSKQAISGYINNYRTPNDDLKKKFADFFNVSVDYLIGRTDDPNTKIIEKHFKPDDISEEDLKFVIELYKDAKDSDVTMEDLKEMFEYTKKVKNKH